MKLLVDTHILLWWLKDDQQLGAEARAVMADGRAELLVSVASFWEISIKVRNGRITYHGSSLYEDAQRSGFTIVDVQADHLTALEKLPFFPNHNDPFDHLILAQAHAEDATLITRDRKMRSYGIRCIPA